jgi:hypothetical protein
MSVSSLQRLKAIIMEPEETAVARQEVGKHVPAAMNTHAIIELLDAVFLYAIRVISNTQHIVKEKWATSSSQNFLLLFIINIILFFHLMFLLLYNCLCLMLM